MKNLLPLLMLLLSVSVMAQNDKDPVLENQLDSISYFLGLTLGYDFQNLPFDANADLVLGGIEAALNNTSAYDRQQTQTVFRKLQQTMQQMEQEKAEASAMSQQEEGKLFLEKNGKREGVVTTASGLQYEVMEKGDGPMPAETSEVEVHYHGTLINGIIFDSSYERGESISFPLNGVIRGWTEGLQLMNVGSIYTFYIPPNSVLIFKVELLGIK